MRVSPSPVGVVSAQRAEHSLESQRLRLHSHARRLCAYCGSESVSIRTCGVLHFDLCNLVSVTVERAVNKPLAMELPQGKGMPKKGKKGEKGKKGKKDPAPKEPFVPPWQRGKPLWYTRGFITDESTSQARGR